MQHAYPGAVVANRVAACQAGVKVGDAVRAADWRILVNLTATVHVAAARQVPVSQRQSWPGERGEGKKKEKKKRERDCESVEMRGNFTSSLLSLQLTSPYIWSRSRGST